MNWQQAQADLAQLQSGELRFLQGDYEKAITGLSTYLEKIPLMGKTKSKALYYRGESNLALKNTKVFSDYDAI